MSGTAKRRSLLRRMRSVRIPGWLESHAGTVSIAHRSRTTVRRFAHAVRSGTSETKFSLASSVSRQEHCAIAGGSAERRAPRKSTSVRRLNRTKNAGLNGAKRRSGSSEASSKAEAETRPFVVAAFSSARSAFSSDSDFPPRALLNRASSLCVLGSHLLITRMARRYSLVASTPLAVISGGGSTIGFSCALSVSSAGSSHSHDPSLLNQLPLTASALSFLHRPSAGGMRSIWLWETSSATRVSASRASAEGTEVRRLRERSIFVSRPTAPTSAEKSAGGTRARF